MNRKRIAALIAAGALMMSACSANIGPSPTAQPIPTQAPAQPQVIIVQQPAPQSAPAKSDDGLLTIFVVFLLMCGGCTALGVAYMAVCQLTISPTPPQPPTYKPAPGNYLVEMTPAQYQEWLQLQIFKARQVGEAQAQWMVRHGR